MLAEFFGIHNGETVDFIGQKPIVNNSLITVNMFFSQLKTALPKNYSRDLQTGSANSWIKNPLVGSAPFQFASR
jgi:hypothetical protein